MIINDKILFVGVPKTGTNSIFRNVYGLAESGTNREIILSLLRREDHPAANIRRANWPEKAPLNLYKLNHFKIHEWNRLLKEQGQRLDNFYKIAFTRNPFTRFISLYYWEMLHNWYAEHRPKWVDEGLIYGKDEDGEDKIYRSPHGLGSQSMAAIIADLKKLGIDAVKPPTPSSLTGKEALGWTGEPNNITYDIKEIEIPDKPDDINRFIETFLVQAEEQRLRREALAKLDAKDREAGASGLDKEVHARFDWLCDRQIDWLIWDDDSKVFFSPNRTSMDFIGKIEDVESEYARLNVCLLKEGISPLPSYNKKYNYANKIDYRTKDYKDFYLENKYLTDFVLKYYEEDFRRFNYSTKIEDIPSGKKVRHWADRLKSLFICNYL